MDGISRSRGWDKEISHDVLPMEQLVLSYKWARKHNSETYEYYVISVQNKGVKKVRSLFNIEHFESFKKEMLLKNCIFH